MTIEAQTPRVSYTGNGVTTAFSVNFQFQDAADLQVRKVIGTTVTTPVLDTDYTVTGGDGDTGTVTFLVAPASGAKIVIFADPIQEQELDLQEGNAAPAEAQERALDRHTTLIQRLSNLLSRAIRLPEGWTATFDATLPIDLAAGDSIVVNEAGTGLAAGENFLTQNSQTLSNNQSSPASVTGALYAPATYSKVVFTANVERIGSSTYEGLITAIFTTRGGSWERISQDSSGDIDSGSGNPCGLDFTMDASTGQIKYSSSNLSGHTSSKIQWNVRKYAQFA